MYFCERTSKKFIYFKALISMILILNGELMGNELNLDVDSQNFMLHSLLLIPICISLIALFFIIKLISVVHKKENELKFTEDKLQNSENRWYLAVEGNNDGLWDWNIKNSSVYFSPKWKKMLGYEENEIGNSLDEWKKRVHPDDLQQVFLDVEKHFKKETEQYRNEHRVLCKDGTYKWILDRGVVMERDINGNPIRMIGTHSDITAHKEELYIQRRKSAMGDLIGIIAHQLKQPLSVISLNKEMIVMDYNENRITKNQMAEFDKVVGEQIDFMNESIDDLKNFFKPNKNLKTYSLKKALDKSIFLLYNQLSSKGIDLVISIDKDINILGVESEIEQVFLNLILNAKDSLLEKKVISPKISIEIESQTDLNILKIVISDNGGGIADEIKERIFDPYFTTKSDKGSGIGLNLSKMIIKESLGGDIRVENSDIGAKFIIEIPISQ